MIILKELNMSAYTYSNKPIPVQIDKHLKEHHILKCGKLDVQKNKNLLFCAVLDKEDEVLRRKLSGRFIDDTTDKMDGGQKIKNYYFPGTQK